MDICQIGHHVGKRVRLYGGATEEVGTVEHVQTVTSTVGTGGGSQAREIIDGYVVVLDGRRLELSPGDAFEVLEES